MSTKSESQNLIKSERTASEYELKLSSSHRRFSDSRLIAEIHRHKFTPGSNEGESMQNHSSGMKEISRARLLIVIAMIFIAGAATVTAQRRQNRAPAKTPPKAATATAFEWPQWGGPNRDFKASAQGIKENWPSGGPAQLWNRPLGEGHSAILVDGGRLYTMYSSGNREVIISLDAASGRTIWEFPYEAVTKELNLSEGNGPHSTPLIVGNLIYAVGVKGTMHALDKSNGRMVWKHDLWTEYGGYWDDRGYSPSPVAYRNTVIVPVGGRSGQCLMAFDQQAGNVLWKNVNFTPAPASPIIINVGGHDQIVHLGTNEIYGADATNGNLLWSHPHKTSYGLNISTPVWSAADNLLFVSSAYGTGSRALQLRRNGNQTSATQVWANNRMRIHFGTAIRLGDLIYGSSGDFGPAFFTAIDARNGQVVWQDRALARANFVHADNKFIILDEDGTLAIASLGQNGLNIHARASVMKNRAWTVPTLAGTKLYLRDRRTIVALDLG
jgi:outer membrane protein assembly factor BamB